jgi:hypothetical protein
LPTGAAACGCNAATDCPVGYACNSSNQCTTNCAGGLTCNGGCCQAIAGLALTFACVPGTAVNACGSTGTGCADCRQFPMMTCTSQGTCQ